MRHKLGYLLLLWSVAFSSNTFATEEVRIAVASNFLVPIKNLAKTFTAETGIPVYISNGASGMLYAKIKRGAPYDIFFSADTRRPLLLEQEGLIEEGSRFTYVMGRLVAWSPNPNKLSADLSKLSASDPALRYLAMANPKTAPYGVASVAVLKHYGLYDALMAQKKIALGESIGKAYQYTVTENAQIGLVAKSYVSNLEAPIKGVIFEIPTDIYPVLAQQSVVIKGRGSLAVSKFMAFFHSLYAQQQIERFGYDLPLSNREG